MKLVIVGATGLVGGEILEVLEERNFVCEELILVASRRSIGQTINFKGDEIEIIGMDEAINKSPDIAIFSAGGGISLEWAPKFAAVGTTVIDNSSAWRMNPEHKLIVPEINAGELTSQDRIIANPNCSTIQMVVALAPLHEKYKLKRIVVSTYQSVSGSGKVAVDQMNNERLGLEGEMAYPHQIDKNVIPHIDVFMDNGYTKEEMKMVNETKKIFGDDTIQLTATTVRIPTIGGHSEALNVEFHEEFDVEDIKQVLNNAEGVIVQDDPLNNVYPMPLTAHKKDEVFVGRIRRDETQPKTLNMWVVADNLRKGAATNAVQIAEYLANKKK